MRTDAIARVFTDLFVIARHIVDADDATLSLDVVFGGVEQPSVARECAVPEVVTAFAGRKNVRRRRAPQIECYGERTGATREYGDAARQPMNGDIVSAPRERPLTHHRSVRAQEEDANVSARETASRNERNFAGACREGSTQ